MGFQSILGEKKLEVINSEEFIMPKYFMDLNLDQIVQDIMDEQKLYDLRRYYYFKAEDEDTIRYRLEILKDLDKESMFLSVQNFTIGIRKTKEFLDLIPESNHMLQRNKLHLDAVDFYVESILNLQRDFKKDTFSSKGFRLFAEWLDSYINSAGFQELREQTQKLVQSFKQMKYNIKIKRDKVIIEQGYIEEDYCKQLVDTFQETDTKEHYYQNNPYGAMILSALEEAVLDVLYKPNEETFHELEGFCKIHNKFLDETLLEFEQEVQFYISFLLYRERMKTMKFHFCYPEISNNFRVIGGYDLALAKKNAEKKKEVIFNDCYYLPTERFFVITGPNQGGKTTFARAIGQILYFSSIGLMVPANEANVPLFDHIYTHFAVEENINNGTGKLKDELIRLKIMMDHVTKNSFVIINEIFTSATSYDAYIMGKKVINYFMDEDCLGIYVTHIHELTKEDERIVSLVAALSMENSNIRTFKIERKLADGLSYANSIVQKHHMTYQEIKERIKA